jgi:hypothetical protein
LWTADRACAFSVQRRVEIKKKRLAPRAAIGLAHIFTEKPVLDKKRRIYFYPISSFYIFIQSDNVLEASQRKLVHSSPIQLFLVVMAYLVSIAEKCL